MTDGQRAAVVDASQGATWRAAEVRRLLDFGAASLLPGGGAAWLDDDGVPDLEKPVHTWITSRMAHTYAVAHLLGVEGSAERAELALRGLTSVLADPDGGWVASRGPHGAVDGTKQAYAHAFVVLAASSGVMAGIEGAGRLLSTALATLENRFFEEGPGLLLDEWDRAWTQPSAYRGVNANMHGVESMLAAHDATGDAVWLERAAGVGDQVVRWAEGNGWRIPEHFDAGWRPQLEFNADRPNDPFKPYGSTPGHGFEWARLLVQIDVAGGTPGRRTEAAVALFDRALADGWDGSGFVYTVDWSGTPVEPRRFHWVAAEAVATAQVLAEVTGEARYAELAEQWWDLVRRELVDTERGSWHHELDAENRPAGTVWDGKPDIYHAVQSLLVADLPLTGSFAASARAGAEGWRAL
ncbi:AGE family epimerase/isomerase [Cellulomonas sp. PhB143]|uniref:AGE family epimerase/isomerase n=1 Tax=Cellulomonas sp. PhB143 TaxID=2485186 RepID=UPI000F48BC9E|nr:AGE family epimerase/isomerase [Cellulomonas sp. PhB143]ROS72132.1 mannose/cellobiose epimerase-like protein (N-acyl-D-glucosamine 2-epimerase family) [Cellulomonas sp. PhB143]